jgi:hypothetical protein
VPTSGSIFSFNRFRGILARRSGVRSAASVETHQLIRETPAHHVPVKNHDVDAFRCVSAWCAGFLSGQSFYMHDTI